MRCGARKPGKQAPCPKVAGNGTDSGAADSGLAGLGLHLWNPAEHLM